MSFPVIQEHISTYFLCKGTWIPVPHCVLRSTMTRIIMKTESGSEVREYKFPDEWTLSLNRILSEMLALAWATSVTDGQPKENQI